MARLVKLTKTGPYRIEPRDFPTDGKSIWVCACGLTKTPPYCDKSHKACDGEPVDGLFVYEDGRRRPATPEDLETPGPPLPPTGPQ